MKKIPALLSIAVLSAMVQLRAQDVSIQSALNTVSIDSLVQDIRLLSGELPVNVGGGDQLILSRNKTNAGNHLAAQWLQQKLTQLGYAPTVQSFSSTGENILATKTGLLHPGRKVVICGHYDAQPGGPVNAPAADDDGSGTCAVLEAARVLAPYSFENTIVFALWDEEEQGLVGSHYYAGAEAASDDTIIAAINCDAIAYDGDGDGLMRIHTKNIANSIAIKDTALQVNSDYGLGLNIAINNPGATYSDHASFWTEGFGSILIIEDFDNDGNPHYHTSTDLLQYMDQPFWAGLTRLGIGTTAVFAVPYSIGAEVATVVAPRVQLYAYPNPFNNTARVWITTDASRNARLSLLDATGREVVGMFEGTLSAGEHAFDLDAGALMPGAYYVRCISADGVRTLRLVRVP